MPTLPYFGLYVVTCPGREHVLAETLASIRKSDWPDEPAVLRQPANWPVGWESTSRMYRSVLQHAWEDGCWWAVVLEDDLPLLEATGGDQLRRRLAGAHEGARGAQPVEEPGALEAVPVGCAAAVEAAEHVVAEVDDGARRVAEGPELRAGVGHSVAGRTGSVALDRRLRLLLVLAATP